MVETNKNTNVVQKYIQASQVAAFTGSNTKVSDIDFRDVAAVIKKASENVNDKIEGAKIDDAYGSLFQRLHAAIKMHLNEMNAGYEKRIASDAPSMTFVNPALYLKYIASVEQGNFAQLEEHQASAADASLSYMFFLSRVLTGQNAVKLAPNFQLAFKKGSSKSYSDVDVLSSFKYFKNGQDLDIFTIESAAKRAVNREAVEMFKADKAEFDNIVKKIFDVAINECNSIKESTPLQATTTCQSHTHYSSPDFFVSFATCLEIINLTQQPGYCPEIVLEDYHLEL